jgi:hypothetical protein
LAVEELKATANKEMLKSESVETLMMPFSDASDQGFPNPRAHPKSLSKARSDQQMTKITSLQ